MEKYLAPACEQRFEMEVKRSRFVTSFGQVADKASAKAFIQTVRQAFPDANHHCWAMVAGRPDDIYTHDQSDDGEPKGTAGKPMLNVLQHSHLGNTAVVVTRFFGGVKLGAGGLVRAYTQSVSGVIGELQTIEVFVTEKIRLRVPYALLDSLEHRLKDSNIRIGDKAFHDVIDMELHVPKSEVGFLETVVNELGNGAISIDTEN